MTNFTLPGSFSSFESPVNMIDYAPSVSRAWITRAIVVGVLKRGDDIMRALLRPENILLSILHAHVRLRTRESRGVALLILTRSQCALFDYDCTTSTPSRWYEHRSFSQSRITQRSASFLPLS